MSDAETAGPIIHWILFSASAPDVTKLFPAGTLPSDLSLVDVGQGSKTC